MTNWDNATLVAWFGAQNCYLAMAAMRPDPPCGFSDGPGDLATPCWAAGHDQLTNAPLASRFGACRCNSPYKESPGRAGAFKGVETMKGIQGSATVPILTIPRVVLVDVAIWVLPDRLKRARPRVLNTDISSPAGAWRNLVAHLVID